MSAAPDLVRVMRQHVRSEPLPIAVHEVGHFALACANGILPKWIRVGVESAGDAITCVGSCGVGDGFVVCIAPPRRALSFVQRRILRTAAIDFAGHVAAGIHEERDVWWDAVDQDIDDPDPDIRKGFARCTLVAAMPRWEPGQAYGWSTLDCSTMPGGDPCPPDVWRIAERARALAEGYLRANWPAVMRMARTLARTPVQRGPRLYREQWALAERSTRDEFRELSQASIDRWASKFPAWGDA